MKPTRMISFPSIASISVVIFLVTTSWASQTNSQIKTNHQIEIGSSTQRSASKTNLPSAEFGDYDKAFIAAVQARWYQLLDNKFPEDYKPGKIKVVFRLHSDGRITDVEVKETNVAEGLAECAKKAIQDPAPFQKWSEEMRKAAGKDFREITFTFYYNQTSPK